MRDDFILKRDLKKLYHVTLMRFLKDSTGATTEPLFKFYKYSIFKMVEAKFI